MYIQSVFKNFLLINEAMFKIARFLHQSREMKIDKTA